MSYIRIPQGIDVNPLFFSIGPVDLTLSQLSFHSNSLLVVISHNLLETLSPATNSEIPTVTDNLFLQGTISANEIAVSFEPLTEDNELNGEITWGVCNYNLKTQPEC